MIISNLKFHDFQYIDTQKYCVISNREGLDVLENVWFLQIRDILFHLENHLVTRIFLLHVILSAFDINISGAVRSIPNLIELAELMQVFAPKLNS